jgi:hypothetical protein
MSKTKTINPIQYETPQFYGPKYVVSFLTSTMVSGGWFWFQLSVDRCLQKAAEKSWVLTMQIKLFRSMFLESNPGTGGQCVSCNENGSLDLTRHDHKANPSTLGWFGRKLIKNHGLHSKQKRTNIINLLIKHGWKIHDFVRSFPRVSHIIDIDIDI